MNFDLKTHLKTLSELTAPSGHEAQVRAYVRSEWQTLVDEFDQDGLGSLIGIKRATHPPQKGTAKRLMLAAHMDEIGLMVRDIVDGFIYAVRMGGMDARTLLAKPVLVHGKRTLKGLVSAVPPHLLSDKDRHQYPSVEQLVIDVGMSDAEVREVVQIGDLITPDAPFWELLGNHWVGKAFDDRACLAAVTLCLHHLQRLNHQWDVLAVATVQEEVGLFGAQTSAAHLNPDLAIALAVTFAPQTGVSADAASEMNGGMSIALGANVHPALFERLLETAKKHEIKYQTEAFPAATGTDAWAIQVAREGIPTALISIPIRNMHSAVETVDSRDIERTARLLAAFISELDADWSPLNAQAEAVDDNNGTANGNGDAA